MFWIIKAIIFIAHIIARLTHYLRFILLIDYGIIVAI